MSHLEKTSFLRARPYLGIPLNLLTVSTCLLAALPFAVALYPSTASLGVEAVESKFKGLKLKDGSDVKHVYFNRGL